MEIARYILFARGDRTLEIPRAEKYGGPLEVLSYQELEKLYTSGSLHPLDLKNAVAEALIKALEPFHRHFKGKEEMVEKMMRLEALK
jgi:tyrosyl-tRNA synthetase